MGQIKHPFPKSNEDQDLLTPVAAQTALGGPGRQRAAAGWEKPARGPRGVDRLAGHSF